MSISNNSFNSYGKYENHNQQYDNYTVIPMTMTTDDDNDNSNYDDSTSNSCSNNDDNSDKHDKK